jgi:hypothetical protein
MKIWHGERYTSDGEKQLIGYFDTWNLNTGYLLSSISIRKRNRALSGSGLVRRTCLKERCKSQTNEDYTEPKDLTSD